MFYRKVCSTLIVYISFLCFLGKLYGGPILGNKSLSLSDPILISDETDLVVPFSKVGNLIIIRAKLDSTVGNFILDTGAPDLVLNVTYFRNYRSLPSENTIHGGIDGNVKYYGNVAFDSLSFGGLKYVKGRADRINLGHIENKRGIKIHGLLGMALFKKFEMIIDFEGNKIHFHTITKKDSKSYKHQMLADTSAYIETDLEFSANKLIVVVYFEGKKLKFVLDTGAETNLIDSRLPDKILDKVIINKRVLISGTGNTKTEALSGSINSINIGNHNVTDLQVIVTNLDKLCYAYDLCINGMLGIDFLSRQKIGFNFVKKKMYIWK